MKLIMSTFLKTILILIFMSILSCEKKPNSEHTENDKIELEKLENSPIYSNAALNLTPPIEPNHNGNDVTFNFDVKNYELGIQTNSINAKELANSSKGQHIHLILNNKPYSAHYDTSFEKSIPNGVHHLVAFLSRSYHESVKNQNSVVVQKLIIGEKTIDTAKVDIEAPTLIYSRPKGKYKGKQREKILLDFFVLNTSLSKEGNKVKAIINNEEFLITDWAPYTISGLPSGENTISLELIDSKGTFIEGPFNKVTRTITVID